MLIDDQLVVASINDRGTVHVSTSDMNSGETTHAALRENFGVDDHNVPGLLLRADGHLMAFYCPHSGHAPMYHRTSTRARDARQWGPEQVYTGGLEPSFTYANPFQLAAEGGRIYNFWRGRHRNPTYTCSDDLGGTWAEARNFIYFREMQRPYVKYASNGRDTIHFAFTEAHPNDTDLSTSLYHAFYRNGQLHRSDGVAVGAMPGTAIAPEQATRIYQGTGNPLGKAWVWDMALDADENPVIVYNTCLGPDDHRYRYARFDAASGRWSDRQIAFAGRCLYDREVYYSGGIAVDPDDPAVVYLSSNVDIRDGSANASGRYELYKGRTGDGGEHWTWQPITVDSTEDNLRPVVPADHGGGTFVLWMQGEYPSYTEYRTRIMLKVDR